MSSSGAEQTTARYSAGRWVRAAPTSSPPFDPPMIASRSGWCHRRRRARSAAACRSSNTYCLCSRLPARCHCSPSSPPPRSDDHRVAAAGRRPRPARTRCSGGQADPEAAVAVDQGRARPRRAVRGDHEHAHRGAVGRGELALLGAHRRRGGRARGGRLQHGRAGSQIEAVHLGRGEEVGPAHPDPAGLRRGVPVRRGQPGQRAVRGQRHRAHGRAVRGRVQRQLGHRVPGPGQHQQRVRRGGAGGLEPAHRLQYRVRVLGDQLPPVLPAWGGRVGDGQPPARRAVGGVQVEPAVAVHPGVALHVVGLGEHRDQWPAGRQVGDPHAVPARGADVAGDQQPAAVPGDTDAVVGVLVVQAGAVDQRVLRGGGADPVPPDPAVEGLLAGRGLVLVHHPNEDQLLATGQPGHVRVAAAVDRRLDVAAGVNVEHVQHRVLVTAVGELVGQLPTLQIGHPGVQSGQPVGVEPGRVEQHPLGAVGLAQVQHRVLLAGLAAGEEGPAGPPQRRRHRAGGQQLAQRRRRTGPGRAARPAVPGSPRPGPPTRPGCADPGRPPASGTGRRPGGRAGSRPGRGARRRGSGQRSRGATLPPGWGQPVSARLTAQDPRHGG